MYFLVNASPPKPLDVATSNFADALVDQKQIFAMVFHRLKSSILFQLLKIKSFLKDLFSVFMTSISQWLKSCRADQFDLNTLFPTGLYQSS